MTGVSALTIREQKGLFLEMVHMHVLSQIIDYVLTTTGLEVRSECSTAYRQRALHFEFTDVDVVEIGTCVKYMRVVDYARGMFLIARATQMHTQILSDPAPALAPAPPADSRGMGRAGNGNEAASRSSFPDALHIERSKGKAKALDGRLRMLALAQEYMSAAQQSEPTFLPSVTEGVRARVNFALLQADHAEADNIILRAISNILFPASDTPSTESAAVRLVACPLLWLLLFIWRRRRDGQSGSVYACYGGAASLLNLHVTLTFLTKIGLPFSHSRTLRSYPSSPWSFEKHSSVLSSAESPVHSAYRPWEGEHERLMVPALQGLFSDFSRATESDLNEAVCIRPLIFDCSSRSLSVVCCDRWGSYGESFCCYLPSAEHLSWTLSKALNR